MRYVMLGIGLLVVLLAVGATVWIGGGEVVKLRTTDPDGLTFDTELWIVEYQGRLYVRGAPHRAWIERLRKHPQVELVGAGRTGVYEAHPVEDPAITAGVNRAMEEKYGMADRIAEELFDRKTPIAIQLDPSAP